MTVITEANAAVAQELLAQLTLDEKIGMIHGAGLFRTEGVPRLGIPALKMSDGPMGVRREFDNDSWDAIYGSRDYVTYLPCGSAVASTWNAELAHDAGRVLGAEARGRGKDVILGPSVNIKRSPLCGRNFEYMSEDPCLTTGQCVPFIEGVQESDVAACVKHFVANNQETDRLHVDEIIADRALRELYLPAFEASVKQAHVLSVMGAYNLVNGERCCESPTFLGRVLRQEWDFDGVVISDWGGVFRSKESAQSGLDVEMSVTADFDDYKFAQPLKAAIQRGEVDEHDVDRKVLHILCMMDALHMLDHAGTPERESGCYANAEHRDAALAVAQESVVLLKNEEHALPLRRQELKRLLVVGANADRVHSNGGGSAEIKALYEVTPLLGLCGQLGGNVEVRYVPGYEALQAQGQTADWQSESLTDGTQRATQGDASRSETLRDEAVRLAGEYEHVIFVGGLDHDHDLEGMDRADMRLPYGQDELIEALLAANPGTIICLVAGSPVEMPWADRAKAIVWSWYGGTEAGTALAQVLLGDVNPSGHLPESFPMRLEDSPAHSIGSFGLKGSVEYAEDIYVGYRYYDSKEVPVRFCFGHGLSYTSFEYDGLDVHEVGDAIRLRCQVTNTGNVRGKAVAQVYLGLEGTGEDRPAKELKGYRKVELEAGERRELIIEIPVDQALRYYSSSQGRYAIAPRAKVYVGQSVEDIRLTGAID
ncbi:MAG: glycoside hydrolase family 3 C-terminal domain-containing protein [Bifidobacterium psychraerophilum]|uniref:beta-glucosidase family protein n=1 Tax=Bifidobacterium psychraerophilum TaxID=218140 RepID=UPI0039E8681C